MRWYPVHRSVVGMYALAQVAGLPVHAAPLQPEGLVSGYYSRPSRPDVLGDDLRRKSLAARSQRGGVQGVGSGAARVELPLAGDPSPLVVGKFVMAIPLSALPGEDDIKQLLRRVRVIHLSSEIEIDSGSDSY